MIRKILITGAAGFIGSHLSERIFNEFKNSKIVLYDKITYAANKNYLKNLLSNKNIKFVKNDLLNFKILEKNLSNTDIAINVAAESHVDNSYGNSLIFTKTNTLGTHCFLEACRKQGVKKIIHVSTDEVYGENLGKHYNEKQILNPTNPYSASKAAADMIVNSYNHSYNLNVMTVRANNIFGTRQFPEKLISKTIFSFLNKKKMTIHGNGSSKRYYLSVEDFCEGIIKIIIKGRPGEIYNISSERYYNILKIVKLISNYLEINFKKNITFIKDRPFNDKIYKINSNKLKKLGWKPTKKLDKELPKLCDWYKKNLSLFK
jgi:dTDP-glucose 4,6-dehydratase